MNLNRETKGLSRRALIKGVAALAGGVIVSRAARAAQHGPGASGSPPKRRVIEAADDRAVAGTAAGLVRGYISGGIYTFKGIPYGAPTGGEARFRPPSKPKPWKKVRSAMAYGPTCPTTIHYRYLYDTETAFLLSPHYDALDEDCLRLNVWTPGLGSDGRRPVMVWLHGGGCTAWSAQFLSCFDGEDLSRDSNVVVVSVNHRLGPFGFLHLAEFGGAPCARSGNAGTLDLIAALEWIRDNVARFGGNPDNVTLFGQSGGGSKIGALLAMPSAKGLFHKAIVMSGTTRGTTSARNANTVASGIMAELEPEPGANGIEKLKNIPAERLLAAADVALDKLAPPVKTPGGFYPKSWDHGWGPTVDGSLLPEFPFDAEAPACSGHVPLMIGTVLNECMPPFFSRAEEKLTESELQDRLGPACGTRTASFLAAYRRAYPGVKPIELLAIIYSTYVRRTAVSWAERKAAQKAAPAYLYWFTWHTPMLDGRPRAFHCLDLPFVFNNTDRCASMTGGGDDARTLAKNMSRAFASFARTGNPNHGQLPRWPEFNAADGLVMIFDSKCEVKKHPDRELILLFQDVLRAHPSVAI
ncbi:MAG: carboxylesterase/lipase family protein [Verrucomicrobia bacterium]|nr:carboxylesterase/lipase family protein [Verrucomicrobiota bacterium]